MRSGCFPTTGGRVDPVVGLREDLGAGVGAGATGRGAIETAGGPPRAAARRRAARLRAALAAGIADGSLAGLAFTQDTAANAVFATLPTATADRIRDRVRFYDWDRARGEVRWMAAWDTTEADVDTFIAVIREEFACAST